MTIDGPPPERGDRQTLTMDERMILENKILPTARHGIKQGVRT